jgi:integrase
MATVSVFLKKSKTNSKGEHPIVLRLADTENKRAYFATGFYSTEKYFDTSKDGGRFFQGRGVKAFTVERKEEDGSTKTYTNKEANDKLAALEERAYSILRKYNDEHVDWGFEQFRSDFTNAPKRKSFLSFAEDIIDKEYESRGRNKSAEIARGAIHSMELYDPQLKTRSFQDINVKYLNSYIDFCRDKGNSDSTLKIRLGEIRRLFNIAIRDKIIKPELYPFSSGKEDGKVRIPKTTPSKTDQYLTLESLRKLASTTFENHVLERTRHLFLFSYYSRGMNWKDMALLTKSSFYPKTVTDETTHKTKQVNMMEYKRSKTKGQFEIQISPNIQRELDWFKENTTPFGDYVLPIIRVKVEPKDLDTYLSQIRKRFNYSLREIAVALKFPESQQNITIYTARHSFAMTLQNKEKPIEIISQALGHQSVETTKHYLAKFSTTKMAEETDIDLFEKPKKAKKTKIASETQKPGTKKSRKS